MFTVDTLRDMLGEIDADTAPGPDGILVKILLKLPPGTRQWLADIFTYCYVNGVTPAAFGRSRVTALYKGAGGKSHGGNYRPISVTSVLARLYEHGIKGVLELQLGPDFFAATQFGFRKAHRTHHHILLLLERIRAAIGSHGWLPAVFLDIKRAFDSVPHPHLLFLLSKAGVRGAALKAVRALLSYRWFFVRDGHTRSQWHRALAGVPQGCVLSPLLFLVYINEAFHVLRYYEVLALGWADDLALLPKGIIYESSDPADRRRARDAFKQLKLALNALAEWAKTWRITFSGPKSGCVWFSSYSHIPHIPDVVTSTGEWPILQLGTVSIKPVSSYKYLGFTLTSDLKWTNLAAELVAQVKSRNHLVWQIVRRRGNHLAFRTVRMLMLNYIQAVLSYYLPLAQLDQVTIRSCDSCVIRVALGILGLPKGTSHDELRAELGLMSTCEFSQFLNIGLCVSAFHLDAKSPHYKLMVDLLRDSTKPAANTSARRSRPITSVQAARRTLADVGLHPETAEDFARLEVAAIRRALLTKYINTHGKSLTKLEHRANPTQSMALYLKVDSAATAGRRARLRLHVSHLNADKLRRHVGTTAYCPHCPAHLQDASHMFFSCTHAALSAARTVMLHDLELLDIRATLPVVLGYVCELPHEHQHRVLRITGHFLDKAATSCKYVF